MRCVETRIVFNVCPRALHYILALCGAILFATPIAILLGFSVPVSMSDWHPSGIVLTVALVVAAFPTLLARQVIVRAVDGTIEARVRWCEEYILANALVIESTLSLCLPRTRVPRSTASRSNGSASPNLPCSRKTQANAVAAKSVSV